METKPVEVDLRFASLRITPTGIEVIGKRGGLARENGETKELPPASGEFRVPLDRFIEIIGSALWAGILNREVLEEVQGEGEDGDSGNPESSEEEVAKIPKRENVFVRFLKGQPEGTSLRILGGISQRAAVNFSIALRQDNRMEARSSGVISPEMALVLMDVAGTVLKKGRYMRPLAVAALYCEGGQVRFMFGDRETGLTDWQQRELKYILSRRFLGDTRPVRFRSGRLSLIETTGRFFLRFSGNSHEITPGDLAVIRAILV